MKKRSKQNLSHYKLLTCRMGYLVPIQLSEVLPGDTVQMSSSLFIRCAPMVAPIMHPVIVKVHHWYVPLRLIWDDFEDFITGGPDGLNASVPPYYMWPTDVDSNASASGNLADFLGVPIFGAQSTPCKVSSLPFRAYNLIYNEWYRDEDLMPERRINRTSGPESDNDRITNPYICRTPWERDYFTTSRPWPQKGAAVTVPINGVTGTFSADITGDGQPTFKANVGHTTTLTDQPLKVDLDAPLPNPLNLVIGTEYSGSTDGTGVVTWDDPALKATITGSTDIGSMSINAFREAMALQRFEEHRALYGSRYDEYLRQLGVRAQDSRLQRPEYLGGGRQTIQFSEVLQTAEGTDPVGTMRGHGIAALRSNRFRRFIPEHGYIMSLMSVHPVAMYQQGLPRLWSRETKEDFFQYDLQHIGQQEVYKREIFATQPDSGDVFGYQNRYDEYRYHESSVAGEFRNVLNYWHMAREFSQSPSLNYDFVAGLVTNRNFASTSSDPLYVMASHSIRMRRIMSRKGNPI